MDSMLKWLIRRADGSRFGPVPLSELCAWAREGRVGPDDQLSQDGEQWMPAPALEELEMRWLVELPDHTLYGPLNGFALAGLLQDGSLSMDLIARHTGDGRRIDAALAALEVLVQERSTWEDQVLDLRVELLHAKEQAAQNNESEAQCQAMQEEADSARRRAEEAAGLLGVLESRLAETQQNCSEVQVRLENMEQENRDLTGRLSEQEAELTARAGRLEQQLSLAEELQVAEKALEEVRLQLAENAARAEARIDELERECEDLRSRQGDPADQDTDEEPATKEQDPRSRERVVKSAVQKLKAKATQEARKSTMTTTAYKRRKAAQSPRKGL